jgi:hypothetical protein
MLAAAFAKLKGVALYVIMVLVLPGGILMALLLWQHRRRKQTDAFGIESAISGSLFSKIRHHWIRSMPIYGSIYRPIGPDRR